MVEYSNIICRTALSTSRLPGLRYSLNPYLGCEHGCIYCYSRSVFRDREMALRWGKFVRAKTNLLEVVAKEVRRKPKGTVGISTVTDPYQPLESKLELTRGAIEILAANDFPISIQTKSNLILRDADVIKPKNFDVGVTITTLDNDMAKKIEPLAPTPSARAQVIEEFSSRGVQTWIFLGPIIPTINDDAQNIESIIKIAERTGSKLLYDKLNLKNWVLESISPFLEKERPGLREKIFPLLSLRSDYWAGIRSKIEHLCKKHSVRCEPAFPFL
ncbi:MAG: hypothetical protein APU95_06170 [Hadesarchaea archaeon YNP_N21]|jgi:DNA repair photolyase|nr:MAG: hypothetical protein APU95_06170 [Hadesarchaea archaeon YNP_N21]